MMTENERALAARARSYADSFGAFVESYRDLRADPVMVAHFSRDIRECATLTLRCAFEFTGLVERNPRLVLADDIHRAYSAARDLIAFGIDSL